MLLRLSPSIVVAEIDGDITAFDPIQSRVVVLNETASEIWRHASGGHTFEDLVSRLANQFGVEATAIREEVATVVSHLIEAGFMAAEYPPGDDPQAGSDAIDE
jgi:hypothetical protein